MPEAATTNVGFFDGDRIVWPKAEILTGVTMALLSRASDSPTVTTPVNLAHLRDMHAAFATNAVIGVRSIAAIDDTQWTDEHPAINTLRRHYQEVPLEAL